MSVEKVSYGMLSNEDKHLFIKHVQDMIKTGYRPLGAPIIIRNDAGRLEYFQAMVLV